MRPRAFGFGMRSLSNSLLLLFLSALTGCHIPDINLATPKPIEVNLNMRLDVYQYSGDAPKDKAEATSLSEAVQRQRNRQEEIQTLKNNRIVGEEHRGLLQIREVPGGSWGDYVKRTVENENADRMALMLAEAKKTNKAIHEVQSEQWKLSIERAFKGEYVEVPGEKDGSFKWIQALGPKEKVKEPVKP